MTDTKHPTSREVTREQTGPTAAMIEAWTSYETPYDDLGHPEHFAAVVRHAFMSGAMAASPAPAEGFNCGHDRFGNPLNDLGATPALQADMDAICEQHDAALTKPMESDAARELLAAEWDQHDDGEGKDGWMADQIRKGRAIGHPQIYALRAIERALSLRPQGQGEEGLFVKMQDVREALRTTMLEQPRTEERNTFSDGFAIGIMLAIQQIDAVIDPKLERGERPIPAEMPDVGALRLAAGRLYWAGNANPGARNDAGRALLLQWSDEAYEAATALERMGGVR